MSFGRTMVSPLTLSQMGVPDSQGDGGIWGLNRHPKHAITSDLRKVIYDLPAMPPFVKPLSYVLATKPCSTSS